MIKRNLTTLTKKIHLKSNIILNYLRKPQSISSSVNFKTKTYRYKTPGDIFEEKNRNNFFFERITLYLKNSFKNLNMFVYRNNFAKVITFKQKREEQL